MSISQEVKNDIKSGALEIKPTTFVLYWHMVEAYGLGSWFEVKHEDTRAKTGLSVGTIMSAIKELIELGLIKKNKLSHKKLEYKVIR